MPLILFGAIVAGMVLLAGGVLIVLLVMYRPSTPTDTPLAQGDTRSTAPTPATQPQGTPPEARPQPTQRETNPAPVPGPGAELKRLIQALKESKEDKEDPKRIRALLELADLGPAARPAVPDLLGLLRAPGEPENVRLGIQSILERLAPLDAAHVPDLREVLLGAEWLPGRVFAVEQLGKMGPDSRPARGALLVAVTDRQ
jgi:hypothetical protein